MSDTNFRYDTIIEASHFNSVIQRLELEKNLYTPDNDPVKIAMYQYMMKRLIEKRDNLLQQGLNGLKDG